MSMEEFYTLRSQSTVTCIVKVDATFIIYKQECIEHAPRAEVLPEYAGTGVKQLIKASTIH